MLGKMNLASLLGLTVILVATIMPVGADTCSNGLTGVQATSVDVCCTDACGYCGGVGCDPGVNSTLTSKDCCATEISESGIYCDVVNAAPCIITTSLADANSTCDNGMTGVQDSDTDVCCPLECGTLCGGEGCGSIPGVDSSQCCAAAIILSSQSCDQTGQAPCIQTTTAPDNANSTCSNDYAGYEDVQKGVCCDLACGQCGGAGCGNIPGLDASSCCSATIEAAGVMCSTVGVAPCNIDPPELSPSTCPNGLAGVQDNTVCCTETCNNVCGGNGCGSILGTNGPSDCCSATILAANVMCDEVNNVVAPCIMVTGTYTSAPTTTPMTLMPSAGSRDFTVVSMAPTVFGHTLAAVAVSSGSLATDGPSMAPTMSESALSASSSPGFQPTTAPTAELTIPPTVSGASSASAGGVVTMAALAAGAFAMIAAGRA